MGGGVWGGGGGGGNLDHRLKHYDEPVPSKGYERGGKRAVERKEPLKKNVGTDRACVYRGDKKGGVSLTAKR